MDAIEKLKEYTELLKLSGKLALAARKVINSNSKNLSFNISELEMHLDEYDNKIIEMTNNSEDDKES